MKCGNTSDYSISIEDKREPCLRLNKQTWVANTHLWMKRQIPATIIYPPGKTDLSPVPSKACAAGGVHPIGNLEISHREKSRYQLPLGERRETTWKSSSQATCTLTDAHSHSSLRTTLSHQFTQTAGLFILTLDGVKDQMLHQNKV